MQIFAVCMECQKELGHPSFEPFFVPYYDDRVASIECSRGHQSRLLIQSQKFEVLLESGANALAAGFTLEAAASFSAALERFYEFCLKIFCLQQGISHDVYDKMFKQIAKQSERQFGAFLTFHALVFGEIYPINEGKTTFRNGVIHKGLIPTPEQVKEYCEYVYDEVFRLSNRLMKKYASTVNEVVYRDLKIRSESTSVPKGVPVATTTGTMFFNLARKENKATFSEAFEDYLKAREKIAGAIPYLTALHWILKLFQERSDVSKD